MPKVKLDLNVKDSSVEIIEKLATEHNITKEKLSEMILEAWTTFGGQIWSGDYKELRAFIIDWPTRRNLVKIK